MTGLTSTNLRALIDEVRLAPSVHNIQPTRWFLEGQQSLLVLGDRSRCLAVADPSMRDVTISHGAAIEGMSIALSGLGLKIDGMEPIDSAPVMGFEPICRLTMMTGNHRDPLAALVRLRQTYRGKFAADDTAVQEALKALAQSADDMVLLTDRAAIKSMSGMADRVELHFWRQDGYRAELVDWMRLFRSHPNWQLDGLNASAMHLNALEAAIAGLVLQPRLFRWLDRFGIAAPLLAESAKVVSAAAIGLFHRPIDEGNLAIGRRFYRVWLEMERIGLQACPMSVLADHPDAAAMLRSEYGIPAGRQLINAFRIGRACQKPAADARARLPVDMLVLR